MHKLCLPVGKFPADGNFRGSVSCIVSPLGIEIAKIDASAHEISGVHPNQPASLWLAVLLAGEGEFSNGEQTQVLNVGDLTYGPSGTPATLAFKTDCQQLFIKIPEIAFNQRMIAPVATKVGYLSGKSGISRVLSGMLRSLAQSMEEVETADLRPVELALGEFLITCLARAGQLPNAFSIGDAETVRTNHLHRISQIIETCLGDPDLKPKQVADIQGVSLRYLQKLFALSGQTFSGFVRGRRIERCRSDLVSPLYAHLSITEICYRWGFNSSAHFSRVFREHFDISPRSYRQQHKIQSSLLDA